MKENIEFGLAYSSVGLIHCPHGGKQGGMQAHMVLEK